MSPAIPDGPPARVDRASPWTSRFAKRTYAAGVLCFAGLAASAIAAPGDDPGWLHQQLDLPGLLYLGSALVGGSNFFSAAIRAARRFRLDMNFLMATATIAAIAIGEPFEAAALATLFSFAELLERFAVDRGRRSIALLLELAPEQAERLRPDGGTEIVPARNLVVGDRIRVRPGDRIATDGRVVSGTSAVNEAPITGESLPVGKRPGDQVYSGSLNTVGALDIVTTADAAHSVLARIVQLVREAEGRRAPIEHFVQRFSRIYTPVVSLLAVLVVAVPPLIGWGEGVEWFRRGITLLVIACPCALVIATPVTVVSALTSAARHGVLIKGGEHLERLGMVRVLATDKTGTLTHGDLAVTSFQVSPERGAREVLSQIVSVESRSEHPIAKAIVRYGQQRDVRPATVDGFEALPGRGLIGRVDGVTITIGTETLAADGRSDSWEQGEGLEIVIFARTDRGASARIALSDTPRPEAEIFVQRLHQLGIRPLVLLTGDHRGPAEAIGKAAGVDVIRARLLPEEKVAVVRELRISHGAVAMVGDGVNDAPALAEATVGIAMGAAGSPATIETADVALMADDLTKVPYAIELGRKVRRTVRFNVTTAILVKAALGVGAITGTVSLAVAVLVGDMGGSLLVTLNALRLAHLHPPGADDARTGDS